MDDGPKAERPRRPTAARGSARSRETRRPCRPAPCRNRSSRIGIAQSRAADRGRSIVVMVDELMKPAKGSLVIDLSVHVRVTAFARVMFRAKSVPLRKRTCTCSLLKSGGLLGSRLHRKLLPDQLMPLIRYPQAGCGFPAVLRIAAGRIRLPASSPPRLRLDPALCLAAALRARRRQTVGLAARSSTTPRRKRPTVSRRCSRVALPMSARR